MELHIRSFDYSDKLPENYLRVIKKYAKGRNVELIKDGINEIAIIKINSLEILPKFEKDIRQTRSIVRSLDFADIHGLIFNTLDEGQKVYQIDIYDSYNE